MCHCGTPYTATILAGCFLSCSGFICKELFKPHQEVVPQVTQLVTHQVTQLVTHLTPHLQQRNQTCRNSNIAVQEG